MPPFPVPPTLADEHWMRRCLQLARGGLLGARPNPLVGAVIVHEGRILGEGYHRHFGGPHAEVNAYAAVRQPQLLPQSTLYVSLEPCAHQGKTPPCVDLILRRGIGRVVVGCIDPFARVSGQGVQRLRQAGIPVDVGVLEQECLALNRPFITAQQQRRPFITLKWAQSSDGFLAPASGSASSANRSPIFFSTPRTLLRVHRLRALHQAVLVGSGTALADNPALTLRHWAGQQPLRILLDGRGRLPSSLQLFDRSAPTLVCGHVDPAERRAHADYSFLALPEGAESLSFLLRHLFERGIQSLLVEGGRHVLQSFIDLQLWDAAHVEIAPLVVGQGLAAPVLPPTTPRRTERFFGHTILHYQPTEAPSYRRA